VISWIVSLAMIGAGLALIALFLLGQYTESTATNSPGPDGFNVPDLETTREYTRPVVAKEGPESEAAVEEGPEDKTLTLTIPGMRRVEEATLPYTTGDDEQALKEHAAIHLEGTGFPWEKEANVYVAGHRLGYPNTDSFLAFWDLDKLEEGDEIEVRDSNGKLYTYRVFKEFIVGPTDISVTEPVEGKNILTLQTCTLPDYSQRLIVQAELVEED
jgi:sortase A